MYSVIMNELIQKMESHREYLKSVSQSIGKSTKKWFRTNGQEFSPLSLSVAQEAAARFKDRKAKQQYLKDYALELEAKFGEGIRLDYDEENDHIKCILSADKGMAIEKKLRELRRMTADLREVRELAFTAIISTVEYFLTMALKEYFQRRPEKCRLNDRHISFLELSKIGTVETAKNLMVQGYVEEILRKDIDDWLKALEDDLGVSFDLQNGERNELCEAFYRRGVLLQNGGRVNYNYFSKVAKEFRNRKIGDDICPDIEYILHISYLLELNFILIALYLWRDMEEQDAVLVKFIQSICRDYLTKNEWHVARGLSHFMMNDSRLSEEQRLTSVIHYYEACKWIQDSWEAKKRECEMLDFSAKSAHLRLARLALLDDYIEFARFFTEHLGEENITYDALDEWSLYKNIRKTPWYQGVTDSEGYRLHRSKKAVDIGSIDISMDISGLSSIPVMETEY